MKKIDSFSKRYGPWALITGASRGIGAEFANQCARRGLNTVLVATNEALLKEQALSIKKTYHVETRTLALDLSRSDILDAITAATAGIEIGLLVNNAGISTVRPFLEHSLEQLLQQLHLNTRSALILAHYFGKQMAERKRGGIIFLSSASAKSGSAYVSNYAGTKAYNLVIGESLWYELKKHGIDILGFMPGSTKTPGWDSNSPKPTSFVSIMGVEETVAEALDALGKHPSWIAGRANRFACFFLCRLLSRKKAISIVSRSVENIFGPFK